jgi:hypothetical protein
MRKLLGLYIQTLSAFTFDKSHDKPSPNAFGASIIGI